MNTNTAKVAEAVKSISEGATITYGALAEQVGFGNGRSIGRTIRSIGDTHGVKIPWWRVVTAAGEVIATGGDGVVSEEATKWAADTLISEGVEVVKRESKYYAVGYIAPAGSPRPRAEKILEPCWDHETVQYSCRNCTA